ncbi:hypothetical protein [Pseudoduganella sp. R-34]|uniref:hypothetical protein n=1 Tax=Pseudoduganella sp. R-34 TaxID=3404062 RepID=UPI003CF3F02F
MSKEQAREFVKIGFAGVHSQNLIGEATLLSVLSSPSAGCEDDFAESTKYAEEAGIGHEVDELIQQSLDLVIGNFETIERLADVIYTAIGNVQRADLLNVLGDPKPERTPPQIDPKPELTQPQLDSLPDQPAGSKGILAWLKSIFSKKT